MKCDDDRTASLKIRGLHQNSWHSIVGIGGKGEMKLRETIGRWQLLDLRRERDAWPANHFEKIGARILNVRAARRQNAENHRREKLPALHGSISRCGRKNYKQLFAPRD